MMIDTTRQLPSPSAYAWSIDLGRLGGPRFVILMLSEHEARERLAEHLTEIGKTESAATGARLIANSPVEQVAVIW